MSPPDLHLTDLLPELRRSLAEDPAWTRFLARAGGVHLAVLVEPYLSYLLTGRKTVESRFGKTKSAPYRRVASGDVVLLKRTGGPIVGVLRVLRAEFIVLCDERAWNRVRSLEQALCADASLWDARRKKHYATLIHVAAVRQIGPVKVAKTDRRPWVILRGAQAALSE